MDKKDISEIRKRFKKDACTFTRLCGCYVDADRNKVTTFGETFLNLDEEEFYKYLEIAKKVMSGTIDNNILEFEFPLVEENTGGRQQFLMELKKSALKTDTMVETFFDTIIENYRYAGNYLILVFHDAYDVMVKTSDKKKLDESEEVYEYLLCAICPVKLSKPALGYRDTENRIGSRIRDWVVGAPDAGFVFPAFTERSSDIHSVMVYTKNVKEPHTELVEDFLGCTSKLTATEQKLTFQGIVEDVIGDDEESHNVFLDIQEQLDELIPVEEAEDTEQKTETPVTLSIMDTILSESGITEEQAATIKNKYEEIFGKEFPLAEYLIDRKLLEESKRRKERLELIQQIENLKQQVATLSSKLEEKIGK